MLAYYTRNEILVYKISEIDKIIEYIHHIRYIIINVIDVRNNVCYNKCGGDIMSYTTNITNARKDLYKLAEMAIENGVEININTKNGNVIMISEDEYRSLLETLYLSSNEPYKKTITDGLKTTYNQTIAEDKVKW